MSTTIFEPATAPGNGLALWLGEQPARPRVRGCCQPPRSQPGLRFAFYGRTSTGRFQDPASSQE
jgi:hypothetical protein